MTSPTSKLTKRIYVALYLANVAVVVICTNLILFEGFFSDNFLPSIKYFPISYGVFCISNLYLTPKFFARKKYIENLIAATILAIVSGVIVGILYYKFDFNNAAKLSANSVLINVITKSIFIHTLFVFKGFAVAIIVSALENSIKKNQIQKERTEEELQFLMFQIQPHFFLNTINNLYALAIENSKKMPQALVHLADMLRHIVYDARDNKTLLFKEVEAVECYIKILQLGFEKPLNISVNISDDKNISIPNCALLTLFEGAVKHSKIGKVSNSFISIKGITSNGKISIEVSNNIALTSDEKEYGGCGLDNLQKQLEIMYHDENILTTKVQSDIFVATLNIPI